MRNVWYLFFLLPNLLFYETYAEKEYIADSLKKEYKAAKQDTIKARVLLELGEVYQNIMPDTALWYFNKSLEISKSEKNKSFAAKCYQNIGNIYFNKSDFKKAYENYQKALNLNEEINNVTGIANNLGNIGNVFYYQKDYDKALVYYKKSLKSQIKDYDKRGMSLSYLNVGNIYLNRSESDSALFFYNKSLELLKELNDSSNLPTIYVNLGMVYEGMKRYDEAISYCKKALIIDEKRKNIQNEAYACQELASVYCDKNEYIRAVYYAKKGLQVARLISNLYVQKDAYDCLATAYYFLGQFKKVIHYKDSVIFINDSIFNEEKVKTILELNEKYETEKKIKKITQQELELNKNHSRAEKQRIFLIFSLSGIVILFLFIIFIVRLYLQKEKINNKLKAINKKLRESLLINKKQAKILSENETKFRTVVNSINDAIILVNNDEKIIFWNKNAEKFFGYKAQEALHMNVHDLITPLKYREPAHRAFKVFKKTGRGNALNKTTELQGVTKWGRSFPIELSLSAMKLNDKWNAIGSVRDISLRKEYELLLKKSKEKIEESLQELKKNIHFAQTIQETLLPSKEKLFDVFSKNCFVIYKPRDIIGGDFYFVEKYQNGNIVFAVGDGTGHGVSGALNSVIGTIILQNISNKYFLKSSAEILNLLRKRIIMMFNKFGTAYNHNGFDIAFCKIDRHKNELYYAGAFIPLWIVRNDELLEYKATRTSIAFCPVDRTFEDNIIPLREGDILYLFSDGYADTFGGKYNKKFKKSRLKELILEIRNEPLLRQKEILETTLSEWKGNNEQTDDITVLCIKYDFSTK